MSSVVRIVSGTVRNFPFGDPSVITTTTVSNSLPIPKESPWSSFQAIVVGTGAVGATVSIYGSNDGTNFCATALGTITLSGTTSATDGFVTVAPWKFVKVSVSAISGTGATVNVNMGV